MIQRLKSHKGIDLSSRMPFKAIGFSNWDYQEVTHLVV